MTRKVNAEARGRCKTTTRSPSRERDVVDTDIFVSRTEGSEGDGTEIKMKGAKGG